MKRHRKVGDGSQGVLRPTGDDHHGSTDNLTETIPPETPLQRYQDRSELTEDAALPLPPAARFGSSKHGMFVLVDQSRDRSNVVDIVALHGLNGHYYDTWSGKRQNSNLKYNWLENDLRIQIPNARIMSYGYDSAIFSKSIADVTTFADQLLEALMTFRSSSTERNRPLVFICHSLGGIVFKKALIRARERDRYEETLKKVRGVAFFGTPHQGSSIADWTSTLGKLLNVASLGAMNHKLLRNLETQASVLYEISKSFVDRGKALSIVSFFETEKLKHTNFVVVRQDSAALLVPNETVVGLPGDHRSICRFSDSPEDKQRIESALPHLVRLAAEALDTDATFVTQLSPEKQMQSLHELYPGDYESFKNANVDRAPGTCEWLLEHLRYRAWVESEDSTLLWVSADAGCGKSTLAKFLVEHLKHAGPSNGMSVSVCHFFFKEGISHQQSTVLAIRAILHQIFARDRALIRHQFPQYEAKGSAMMHELDTLISVLISTVCDPESPSFILIFDGLDECPGGELDRLLGALNKVYAAQGIQQSRSGQYLKVLMLSRPENSIKTVLQRQPMTIRLKGEDEIEAISKDVSLVIQRSMADLEGDGIPALLLKDFSKNLEAGADNTFLWVSLVIKILQDLTTSRGGASRNEILALLKNRDIYSVYNHLLGKLNNQQNTRKLLQIILAAERPFTLDEMGVALAVAPEHRTLDDILSDVRYPCENNILSLGGHFIRIIHSKIYLVHQTAREFLLGLPQQPKTTLGSTWQHSITIKECHQILLGICLCYLACGERANWGSSWPLLHELPRNFKDFTVYDAKEGIVSGEIAEQSRTFWSLLHSRPLFGYASKSWPFHFRISEAGSTAEFLSQAVELCKIVPKSSGYPAWTAVIEKHRLSDVSYWTLGNSRSEDSRRVRVALCLRIHEIAVEIIKSLSRADLDKGDTLLNLAAALGSPRDFLWVVEHYCSDSEINKQDDLSETALNLVLQRKEFDGMAEKLIVRGASAKARGPRGRTPLHTLAKYGFASGDPAALIRVLVDAGADVNAKDDEGYTPVLVATEAGNTAVVEALLTHNPKMDVRNKGKKTILHIAAESAGARHLDKILDASPDITLVDGRGRTALGILRRRPTMDSTVMSRLIQSPDKDDSDETQSVEEPNNVLARLGRFLRKRLGR